MSLLFDDLPLPGLPGAGAAGVPARPAPDAAARGARSRPDAAALLTDLRGPAARGAFERQGFTVVGAQAAGR